MQRSDRLETIIRAARVPGGARVADLAEAAGVTAVTIRRDLERLEDRGIVRRIHGGVVAAQPRGSRLPYGVRIEQFVEEKARIAEACNGLIEQGISVILDDGSTCEAVARQLSGRNLTVLALSIPVAAALGNKAGTTIITPGGTVDPEELSWTGSSAVDAVRNFRADVGVVGICGWMPSDGPSASTLSEAEGKKVISESSTRTIAIGTSDKFESSAPFLIGGAEPDNLIVHGLASKLRATLESHTAATITDVEVDPRI